MHQSRGVRDGNVLFRYGRGGAAVVGGRWPAAVSARPGSGMPGRQREVALVLVV